MSRLKTKHFLFKLDAGENIRTQDGRKGWYREPHREDLLGFYLSSVIIWVLKIKNSETSERVACTGRKARSEFV
jgi:hypothetical protein